MRIAPLVVATLALTACGSGGEGDPAPPPAANEAAPTAAAPAEMTAGGSGLKASVSGLRASVSGLNSRVTDMGTIVELPSDALFAFDSAELDGDAETLLRKALAAIRQAPEGPSAVIGHTDSKGEDAYNQGLSERRARAVADWLGGQPGVRQREIRVEGRGEREPVAPNALPDGKDDEAGRARNRRVELVLPNAR